MNMTTNARNIVIVPVNVSYDRLFEIENLATEMISGQNKSMNTLEVFYEIKTMFEGQLGSVYVKYLKPIPVHDFLVTQGYENLKPED
jgi:glycerol-3-phosphate O-acyltransferase